MSDQTKSSDVASSDQPLSEVRRDYRRSRLDLVDTPDSPWRLLQDWVDAARAANPEPNAMVLSTVDPEGQPNSRVVLLKGLDEKGLVFYTNYESQKGLELAANPAAALNMFWPELERQIRVQGSVERVSASQSDAYFQSRPLASQIGAWASPQSSVLTDRSELERRVAEFEARHEASAECPRPPHWGGYRLEPHRIEFWQGRRSRLHDRIVYSLAPGGDWSRQRLAP